MKSLTVKQWLDMNRTEDTAKFRTMDGTIHQGQHQTCHFHDSRTGYNFTLAYHETINVELPE